MTKLCEIRVKVTPKSKVRKLENLGDGSFIVKVSAPPEDGKANKEVIEMLADYFDVPRSKIALKSGASSRQKIFLVEGADPAKIKPQLKLC